MKKSILIIFCIVMLSGSSIFAETITTDNWRDYVDSKIKDEVHYEKIRPKLDVFLYYEIYDAFCRKYKYKYSTGSYTRKIPAIIKVNSKDRSSDSDYKYFYDKYKDYISGSKSPDSEFISARKKLEEKEVTATLIPERNVTEYYQYLDVNTTDAQKIKEVDKVWIAKKGKVMPKPYSLERELNHYKKLTNDDIKFVMEEYINRLRTVKIFYYPDTGRVFGSSSNELDTEIKNDLYNAYRNCNGNNELFRVYAKDIDKKYDKYYPQNL